MIPTLPERTASVLAEGEAGAILTVPAAVPAQEITDLLVAVFAALLTGAAVEVLGVVAVLISATALLAPITLGALPCVRRLLDRQARREGTNRREVLR